MAESPKFLKGNQLWKLRTVHGREKLISDPALLLNEAKLYFDWCDKNPWLRAELVKHQGEAEQYDVPIGRPYTIDGLTVYLGLSASYFRSAKGNLREKIEGKTATPIEVDLLEAIETVELWVRDQQISGAAVGVFNASIIARLNGLAENVNNNNTGDAVLRVTVRDPQTAQDLKTLESIL